MKFAVLFSLVFLFFLTPLKAESLKFTLDINGYYLTNSQGVTRTVFCLDRLLDLPPVIADYSTTSFSGFGTTNATLVAAITKNFFAGGQTFVETQNAIWHVIDAGFPITASEQNIINTALLNVGAVNLNDFVVYVPVNTNIQPYLGYNPKNTEIPEPACLILLGTGLAVIGNRLKKKKVENTSS